MAHIKIYTLQTAVFNLYDAFSEESREGVQRSIDSELLRKFYALDENMRNLLFIECHKLRAINDSLFKTFWRACYGNAGLQRAADIQEFLLAVDNETYWAIQKKIDLLLASPAKSVPARVPAPVPAPMPAPVPAPMPTEASIVWEMAESSVPSVPESSVPSVPESLVPSAESTDAPAKPKRKKRLAE